MHDALIPNRVGHRPGHRRPGQEVSYGWDRLEAIATNMGVCLRQGLLVPHLA